VDRVKLYMRMLVWRDLYPHYVSLNLENDISAASWDSVCWSGVSKVVAVC
jgi:hypothetical protein